MTSFLTRAIAAVRVYFGMNDPADNRSYPSHGWLLPPLGAPALVAVKVVSPSPLIFPGRRQ